MNADERRCLDELTEQIIAALFEVSNVLGCGFLEKVYERALLKELALRGLRARTQVSFRITYKGQFVGDYFADLIVEDKIIVELKCVDSFTNEHLAQCLNYLKAAGLQVALLVNFQRPRAEWKRVVLDF
jgi:GxxExxY protein